MITSTRILSIGSGMLAATVAVAGFTLAEGVYAGPGLVIAGCGALYSLWLNHADKKKNAKPVPRTLEPDVLNDRAVALPLPTRIERAVELSVLESRTLGVVTLRLNLEEGLASDTDDPVNGDPRTALTRALEQQLRKTDRIDIVDKDIVVCLPLLAQRRDLERVAKRLAQTARTFLETTLNDDFAAPFVDVGIALYPIDGYRGADLLATARADAKHAWARRVGKPTLKPKTDGPKPVLPPRKPVRSPRPRSDQSARRAG